MAQYAPTKAGFKTTEFWLSLVVTITTLLIASGNIPTENPYVQIASAIAAALSQAGYSFARAKTKNGA